MDKILHYFSPGRINLIGEHIDYNGGFVLPFAISLGTKGELIKRSDQLVVLRSNNFKDEKPIIFSLDKDLIKESNWADYVKGVISIFKKDGYAIHHGFELTITSDLPMASGLSSSASLENLICLIINDLNNLQINRIELVKIAQRAENEFIGVNCGIMDQFAIMMSEKAKAILLNTTSLDYQMIPFDINGYVILIMNTGVQRSLISSKYNERRSECDEGLKIIKSNYSCTNICDISSLDLLKIKDQFDEIIYRRVFHAISENERVKIVTSALKENNLQLVGKCLNDSHQSLKNNYEVTGVYLDTIVKCALEEKEVIGARMTGAGFAGCAIALVKTSKKSDDLSDLIKRIKTKYDSITNLCSEFYLAYPVDGTHKEE